MRISDWSSDVCSSDLVDGLGAAADPAFEVGAIVAGQRRCHVRRRGRIVAQVEDLLAERGIGDAQPARRIAADRRTEERRGGNERVRTCRSRGAPSPVKKKK